MFDGHTRRKPQTSITREALEWNRQGQRKRGMKRTKPLVLRCSLTESKGRLLDCTYIVKQTTSSFLV